MRDIMPEETKKYRHIISGQFSNFVLLATEFEGIETAVIAALNGTSGNYVTEPLAVIVNKEILKKLKNPGDILISGKIIVLE